MISVVANNVENKWRGVVGNNAGKNVKIRIFPRIGNHIRIYTRVSVRSIG
jgi:hypothetical protein